MGEKKKKVKEITKTEDLKSIDFASGGFIANGNEYIFANKLTADRFFELQRLEIDLRYGFNHVKFNEHLREMYEMANKSRFADVCVTIYNLMQSIVDLDKRHSAVYWYCTVFVNRKDEDVRLWNEDLAQEKIEDWSKEGIDFNSFFLLALNIGSGLKSDYIKATQNMSEQVRK